MNRKSKIPLINFNAPVILGFTLLSLVILLLNQATNGEANKLLAVRFTSWKQPIQYLRLFTHVAVHANMSHYTGNFLLILAVGPLIEEKYGSVSLLIMILITALITGLISVIFFKNVVLLGASGVVFMLILLSSFTNIQEGHIPLTVILVGGLYIGNEIITGLTVNDNVSRLTHIVGGLCGAGFGYFHHRSVLHRR